MILRTSKIALKLSFEEYNYETLRYDVKTPKSSEFRNVKEVTEKETYFKFFTNELN